MCGFTFTVFLSAFQLLPTAPFHVLDLGGSTFASGLFLGFLTYSSALSAPLTGAFADRTGQRRVLITSSIALTMFSLAYAVIDDYRVLLGLVIVHGVFWSGLLSASAAYMTGMLPEQRRAEGIGYWGLSSVAAIAVAPTVGFWIYHLGWVWLCLGGALLNAIMTAIAWSLPEHRASPPPAAAATPHAGGLLEWRVLIVSVSLFLYSYGYGGITSFAALYADANGTTPKGIYLTALAGVILVTRPFAGRLGDRLGYKRVFVPCLALISVGLALLALGGTRLDGRVRDGVRPGIRHGVPGLCRVRDAGRRAASPRRRLWRDPRRVRHRRRHRIDHDGMDDSGVRVCPRLRRRCRPVGARVAVLSRRGPSLQPAADRHNGELLNAIGEMFAAAVPINRSPGAQEVELSKPPDLLTCSENAVRWS